MIGITKISRMAHMVATEQDRDWVQKLPYLSFPAGWQVKVIPPITMAVVRFHVINSNGAHVSAYFDAYDALGYVGQPYWEIYPAVDGDTERFLLGEETQMIEAIGKVKL